MEPFLENLHCWNRWSIRLGIYISIPDFEWQSLKGVFCNPILVLKRLELLVLLIPTTKIKSSGAEFVEDQSFLVAGGIAVTKIDGFEVFFF